MSDAPQRDEHGRFSGGTSGGKGGNPWTPHTEIGLQDAEGVIEGGLSENAALIAMGLDPDAWEVVSYRIGRWPGQDGETKESTRLSAKRRQRPLVETLDIDELRKDAQLWVAPTPPVIRSDEDALVVCLADIQIGKSEGGSGTRETISRVLAMGGAVTDRVNELRANGRPLRTLVLLGLGDIVEGCDGFYPSQRFSVDLDDRGQIKTAYMLISALLRQWADLFPVIEVGVVGGNHGVQREGGKDTTGFANNKDILAFEIVRDILAERPGFGHVNWHFTDDISTTLTVSGVTLGFTHGHVFSGGVNSAARAEKWWKGQTFGLRPVKDANILYSSHFHHLSMVEFAEAGRTWFQTPANDPGSAWFRDFSGQSSAPGTLTMRVGRSCGPRMWDDLKVV